jgi:S1-C subfamily serine protease
MVSIYIIKSVIILTAIIGLLAAFAFGKTFYYVFAEDQVHDITKTGEQLPYLSKLKDSIVMVTSIDEKGNNLTGSGFIYDKAGHIVTDYHLVVGKERIDVTFQDGSIYSGKIDDGAPPPCGPVVLLVNVPTTKLMPVSLGNSMNLTVGDQVASVATEHLLSENIIKGKIKELNNIISPSITNLRFPIADMIQIDVPIQHAFYGGPVVNMKGEVIGMNLATSTWNDLPSYTGIVVPSNTVNKVIPSMMRTGTFEHPWIGISANNTSSGVFITEIISNSPAYNANIEKGDIIQKIDNITIGEVDDILNYIQKYKNVGDMIELSLERDNQVYNVDIKLVARPDIEFLF